MAPFEHHDLLVPSQDSAALHVLLFKPARLQSPPSRNFRRVASGGTREGPTRFGPRVNGIAARPSDPSGRSPPSLVARSDPRQVSNNDGCHGRRWPARAELTPLLQRVRKMMRLVQIRLRIDPGELAWCWFPRPASAQDPQALRQEIDQLRRDFEALKQQYGDRLAALEYEARDHGRHAGTAGCRPSPVAAGADGARASGRGRRRRSGRCLAGVRRQRRELEGLQSRHGGDRRFSRRRRQQHRSIPSPRLQMHESEAIVSGGRRSACARRFLHLRSARKASISRKASSPSRRCRAAC